MSWTHSLVRISSYQVETLQKRLGEIVERRHQAELRIALLDAAAEAETDRARSDPEAGWHLAGFLKGLKVRRAAIEAEIAAIALEEQGAREALSEAFEEQKKYEQVAENVRLAARKEAARRETAVLDELGLRRLAGR